MKRGAVLSTAMLLCGFELAAPAWADGVGAGQQIPQVISRVLSTDSRLTVPALTGMVATRPVTVTGTGPVTVVAGNVLVNSRTVQNSMLEVRCPRPGHQVIVRDNFILNGGRIVSADGAAGMAVIRCPYGGANVQISNNMVASSGDITAR